MTPEEHGLVSLDPETPFWDRFSMVAPLVVIGTRDANGAPNLAPKHMATPMGWQNHFGFVCTPRHATYQNATRTGIYTVSYPRPSQVVLASLAASPRTETTDGPRTKPALQDLPMLDATAVDAPLLQDAYLFLECAVERIVDDLGDNSLLIGTVVAVHVDEDALRTSEEDAQEALHEHPLLAYVPPDRYATIRDTNAFPFPEGFEK
jgi:flavin reductase (DIM6/NTAB) family NADH-FMN oxidoreductase RutF